MRWFLEVVLVGGPAALWIFVAGLYIVMSSLALFIAPLKPFQRYLVAGTIGFFSLLALILGLVAYGHAMDSAAAAIAAYDVNRVELYALAREQAALPRNLGLIVATAGASLGLLGCLVGRARDRAATKRLGIAG